MKLSSIINKIILILLGVMAVCVLYMNIIFIINTNINIGFIIIPAVIIFGIIFIMVRYSFNFITLVFSIFIISFLLCFIVSKSIKTEPILEFKVLYDASVSLSKGDTSFSTTEYFVDWADKTGFVIYQSAIIKAFGEKTEVLILLNCIYMSIINILVFLIASVITKNIKAGAFSAYVYMLYPAKYLYVNVLTDQHLSLLLFLLSVYVILRFGLNKISIVVTSVVLICIANFIRPEGIIYILALISYLFYININKIKTAVRLSIIVCIIFLGSNIIFGQVVKININKHKINIITGIISEIIKAPKDFIYTKNANFYTPLEQTYWSFTNHEQSNNMLDLILKIDKFYYTLVWLLCFASLMLMLKNNCKKMIYIKLILLWSILTYQIIEIQVQYRYSTIIYLFISISVFYKYLNIHKKTNQ